MASFLHTIFLNAALKAAPLFAGHPDALNQATGPDLAGVTRPETLTTAPSTTPAGGVSGKTLALSAMGIAAFMTYVLRQPLRHALLNRARLQAPAVPPVRGLVARTALSEGDRLVLKVANEGTTGLNRDQIREALYRLAALDHARHIPEELADPDLRRLIQIAIAKHLAEADTPDHELIDMLTGTWPELVTEAVLFGQIVRSRPVNLYEDHPERFNIIEYIVSLSDAQVYFLFQRWHHLARTEGPLAQMAQVCLENFERPQA